MVRKWLPRIIVLPVLAATFLVFSYEPEPVLNMEEVVLFQLPDPPATPDERPANPPPVNQCP
jgi:hypothetical protein